MQYIVRGMFTMAVEAEGYQGAKQAAERILRNDGIKAIALDATENNGKRGRKNETRSRNGA
jgi:hypothetical protein